MDIKTNKIKLLTKMNEVSISRGLSQKHYTIKRGDLKKHVLTRIKMNSYRQRHAWRED